LKRIRENLLRGRWVKKRKKKTGTRSSNTKKKKNCPTQKNKNSGTKRFSTTPSLGLYSSKIFGRKVAGEGGRPHYLENYLLESATKTREEGNPVSGKAVK